MSNNDYGLIDHVSALMIEASETLIMPLYQNLSADDIATKSSDTDLVTIADREAEFWLLPRLSMLLDVQTMLILQLNYVFHLLQINHVFVSF